MSAIALRVSLKTPIKNFRLRAWKVRGAIRNEQPWKRRLIMAEISVDIDTKEYLPSFELSP